MFLASIRIYEGKTQLKIWAWAIECSSSVMQSGVEEDTVVDLSSALASPVHVIEFVCPCTGIYLGGNRTIDRNQKARY